MYKSHRRSSADEDVVDSLALPCAHFIPHCDYQTATCTTDSRRVGIEQYHEDRMSVVSQSDHRAYVKILRFTSSSLVSFHIPLGSLANFCMPSLSLAKASMLAPREMGR